MRLVAARAGQPAVRGQQCADLPGDPDPGRDKNYQVVAYPFQVGDQVRGQHDAGAVLGDRLHQALQELPPGQRVQAGERLVEDEQLGPLGQCQGEGELGSLAAGQRPGPLPWVQAELPDPAPRQLVVPAGVEPGAEAEVIGDPHPGVDGGVLGDEADPGQLRRPGRGTLAEDSDRAASRRQQPGGQAQQGGLARAVGADEPGDVAFGDRQRAVAQRPGPPVLPAQPAGIDDGAHHATPSAKQARNAVR